MTVLTGKFNQIDEAIFKWFNRVCNPVGSLKPLTVSRAALQARALHEAKLRGFVRFKASSGWLR